MNCDDDKLELLNILPICRKCEHRHIDELVYYTECKVSEFGSFNVYFIEKWRFVCKDFKEKLEI